MSDRSGAAGPVQNSLDRATRPTDGGTAVSLSQRDQFPLADDAEAADSAKSVPALEPIRSRGAPDPHAVGDRPFDRRVAGGFTGRATSHVIDGAEDPVERLEGIIDGRWSDGWRDC